MTPCRDRALLSLRKTSGIDRLNYSSHLTIFSENFGHATLSKKKDFGEIMTSDRKTSIQCSYIQNNTHCLQAITPITFSTQRK